MLKKKIKYTDFNGNVREEEFYFNLNKAELMEMELTVKGGFGETIKSIINAGDTPTIVNYFKQIILKSYGEKTVDGKSFMKTPEITKAFECSNAYSVLFMELSTNEEEAAKFINGVIPSDLADQVKEQQAKQEKPAPATDNVAIENK